MLKSQAIKYVDLIFKKDTYVDQAWSKEVSGKFKAISKVYLYVLVENYAQ